ncbi:type 1 periplasmic-binding domain-containing protein [Sphaerisporangium rhizosphaerae]|uniref:BMP family ABC transporter substrate-binding protein n=1 Tax=Sphaerisporangium rhizosphaerae TaxID=2269375 RepID=A0ABW2P237_9ACTN
MRSRRLPAGMLAVAVATAALLAGGCGSEDDWSRPHARPSAMGALGPGFLDRSAPPAPEATITPRPGSWDGTRPSEGYRVVLLTAGTDPQTRTLVNAVTQWAEQERVSLKTVTATRPDQYIARISEAIRLKPDLVVSAGNDLVDPLAMVTPNHLDQRFLVIGAELAEPTANVTAADWTGASFRGEGLGMSSEYDPATFTPDRAARALRAGVAAVLNGLTGIVIWLD